MPEIACNDVWKGWVLEMNGINYNTLLGNTGLFSQQTNTVADELKYKGTSTKEKTTDKKQTNARP